MGRHRVAHALAWEYSVPNLLRAYEAITKNRLAAASCATVREHGG
jgi:hypothetical protein